MKWFKMDCDAQENLDMRKLIDEWGWDWYGRYWAILGMIGMLVNEHTQTFALQTNDGRPFPVRLLANDCQTNVERMTNFLDYLADNHLIDKDAWKTKKLIYAPKLKNRADEYTKKLLTKSRHSPDQEVEEEVEEEQKEKEITSLSGVQTHWNAIAKKNGLREIVKISAKRAAGIRARLAEAEFDLGKIEQEIENSDFLRGRGGGGWRVDFDFIFLSSNNYLKVLEGKYRNGNNEQRRNPNSAISRAAFKHTEADAERIGAIQESLERRDRERRERSGSA